MATDDCWATYRELQAKGVEFIEPPEERFYGIDAALPRPLRQPLAAHPAQADGAADRVAPLGDAG